MRSLGCIAFRCRKGSEASRRYAPSPASQRWRQIANTPRGNKRKSPSPVEEGQGWGQQARRAATTPLYIHEPRYPVCIAIHRKPHTVLRCLTGHPKKWQSHFLGKPAPYKCVLSSAARLAGSHEKRYAFFMGTRSLRASPCGGGGVSNCKHALVRLVPVGADAGFDDERYAQGHRAFHQCDDARRQFGGGFRADFKDEFVVYLHDEA